MVSDALLHFGKRLGADKIDLHLLEAAAAQVQMSVVESGHDEASAEIDHRRLRALQFFDLIIGADGEDSITLHGNRLFSYSVPKRWAARKFHSQHAGPDISVDEDCVGRSHLCLVLRC